MGGGWVGLWGCGWWGKGVSILREVVGGWWDDGDVSGGIMGGDRQKKDDGDGV